MTEQTAQQLWDEILKEDSDDDVGIQISKEAQGADTNGAALNTDSREADHGAAALIETNKDGADPPKADSTKGDPPKVEDEKTVTDQLEAMRQSIQDEADRREALLREEIEGLRLQPAAAATAKAAAEAAGAAAPSKAEVKEAVKTTEKWKALKEQFPEWTEAFEEQLASVREDLKPQEPVDVANLEKKFNEVVEARVAKATEELTARMENRLVERVHRGWKQTIKSPEFVEWYGKQDEATRRLGASPMAEDAIDLLDKYVEFKKAGTSAGRTDVTKDDLSASNRERLSRASAAPNGQRGVQAKTSKSPEDMTPEEYWNFIVAQDAKAA